MTSTTTVDCRSSEPRVRHPRHRVRRRDEEGRVHDHELPDAEAGRAVDALLGDAGARRGDTSILFGLSGTGKTTLSADPKRLLIGDDEHCWTDRACSTSRAAATRRSSTCRREQEPDIWNALQFGAVLENVVYDADTRAVDYDDTSITENTRGSYPIEYIPNAKLPCVGGHPKNVIFLTADAFGVLPPVCRLTPAQAMYHFISGYTAKVAGTEVGVKEPKPTFSPCFGGPFLVWHPTSTPSCSPRSCASTARRPGWSTPAGRAAATASARASSSSTRARSSTRSTRARCSMPRRPRIRCSASRCRPAAPRFRRRSWSRATRGPTRPRTTRRPRRSRAVPGQLQEVRGAGVRRGRAGGSRP